MNKLIILICFCSYSLSVASFEASLKLRAAVADGFPNGLHTKYLRYIATQLKADISITTMPFARRVKEIKNGNLDLIVGIQKTEERAADFVYIEPHYESLSYRFFALTENVADTAKYQDLYNKLIGVNKHSKYFPVFDIDQKLHKVEVVSLRQNINLVLKSRIDLLIHYAESTLPMLKSMQLENKLAQTHFQPKHSNLHYVAISSKSPLMAYRKRLKYIVKQGIKNNEFANIRQQHYLQLNIIEK